MQKDISIVIVNYNVCHFLEQALMSVYQALSGISAEVFVVDNNSVDGSVAMVRSRFEQVHLIVNTENVGFSAANNQAIRRCVGRYVLLLNPDTVVGEDTFALCLAFMDGHLEAGGLGVRMVDGSGCFLPESKRSLPSPWVAFFKIFGFSALFARSKVFGRYHLGYLDNAQTHSVEVLSGAFMWLRRSVLDQIGMLDEAFFMYGEDVDLSYRIIKAGYKNYYFADTQIIHYKGESTKRGSTNYVRIFYRAMAIFAQKHYGGSGLGFYLFFIRLAIGLRALLAIFKRWVMLLLLPLVDAGLIFVGMDLLTNYWQTNHKLIATPYPSAFMAVVVPVYIMVWLGVGYLGGTYDKPYRLSRIVRAIAIATLFISATTNFLDSYRFSKALILLGGVWAVVVIASNRLLVPRLFRFKHKNNDTLKRRIGIVGSSQEAKRIADILTLSGSNTTILGRIDPQNLDYAQKQESILGNLKQLGEICDIYKIDEIIFCTKDMSIQQIIFQMSHLKSNCRPDYRLIADASNYIIGSNSKNTQSDYYSYQVQLAIYMPENRRKKRIFDIGISLGMMILFPILAFSQSKPKNFIKNILKVLWGNYGWVGLSAVQNASKNAMLKPGIFTAASGLPPEMIRPETIEYLEFLYAKDYSLQNDWEILLRNKYNLSNQ